MKDENPCENRAAKSSKFSNQNQIPKGNHTKSISNSSKLRSSWGSHIVKGFSAERKSKFQSTVPTKKLPLTSSDIANQKNPLVPSQSLAKRSLVRDLSNPTQVHPHPRTKSHDLFLELDQLRSLLQESKDREFKLQAQLSECKRNPKILDLERELELNKSEIDNLVHKVGLLESEKLGLAQQWMSFTTCGLDRENENPNPNEPVSLSHNLEMEVVELRRVNKELQLQKRNLACRLSSMESQMASPATVSENDIVAKIKAEANLLKLTNEDLIKQVEDLQMSRLNEVEELVYLRWVNSCLRNELHNFSTTSSDKASSPDSIESSESVNLSSYHTEEVPEYSSAKRLTLIKKLKKWPITEEDLSNLESLDDASDKTWVDSQSPRRRHSISGSNFFVEDLLSKRRQSDGFICIKEIERVGEPLATATQKYGLDIVQKAQILSNFQETNKMTSSLDVEKRALRVPNPPPRPSCAVSNEHKDNVRGATGVVQRAPEVVEFYHSLMKRDSRKDSLNGGICDTPDVANVRSSMIGEIENRSSHLLAIKVDVETQGEFVNYLIREVNNAVYQDIEDVVAFVKWLDDELCFLVDERAVLKHFDWPEKKADMLREAAFGYRDLKKLEYEVSNYQDHPQLPCDIALKKMVNLSEKMERIVYNLLRTRESLMCHCKEVQIPTNWMLDSGIVSKIKFGSVKLAKKYMKRVAMELQAKGTSEKDCAMDYMLLQGVRFAFRIHQFAGGFDTETMRAFEELRNLALVLNKK
ncbi:hydroxyproline-rich glycoprotein family protein [Actinidia rufa]|uniref:Hydroxyproline-rich glycoprotein family protein n=1 Tax=Actinidia rufa TaxID=165716 RepID=A0A7J0EWS6_9ERIC|nr:hydroxyproline-rich glycoprotein family protein [Actinidia rufa]